ncbi:actin-binding protein wsp1-like [Vicia villosa]|uniref:actin-binding protein wsp1-like n=1 Tax=Vicia villosa TaxID=3911 RepID=UPI00273CB305|nr:actin-binding protein wsp1-like [Vicia villosa]
MRRQGNRIHEQPLRALRIAGPPRAAVEAPRNRTRPTAPPNPYRRGTPPFATEPSHPPLRRSTLHHRRAHPPRTNASMPSDPSIRSALFRKNKGRRMRRQGNRIHEQPLRALRIAGPPRAAVEAPRNRTRPTAPPNPYRRGTPPFATEPSHPPLRRSTLHHRRAHPPRTNASMPSDPSIRSTLFRSSRPPSDTHHH